MKCVLADPIGGSTPGVGEIAFWGTFFVNGYYPIYGYPYVLKNDISVTHPVTGASETIDTVYLAWTLNSPNPCDSGNWEVWMNLNGDWFPYGGTFEIDDTIAGGPPERIVDDRGFVPLRPVSFKYGVYGLCSSGNFTLENIYHLQEDKVASITDACDDLDVEQASDSLGNDNLTDANPGEVIDCCMVGKAYTADWNFGRGTPNCTMEALPQDLGGFTPPDSIPYQRHVWGGCIDGIAEDYEQTWGEGNTIEGGDATKQTPAFRPTWSGAPQKELC